MVDYVISLPFQLKTYEALKIATHMPTGSWPTVVSIKRSLIAVDSR